MTFKDEIFQNHKYQYKKLDFNKEFNAKCIPPARIVFVLMSFLGFNLIYSLRVNLSVVIVSMIKNKVDSNEEIIDFNRNVCIQPSMLVNQTSSKTIKNGEFDWDASTQGMILGCFFWGYVITQLPGGRVAETVGSKWLLCFSMFCVSVISILSPFAARIHYMLFIFCRVLEGVCQGVSFPAMNSMIAKWVPKFERSLMSALIYSGANIGTVITLPFAAIICDSDFLGGWPAVFYICGILGIIWSIFWALIVHESPEEHPTISQQELRYILQGQTFDQNKKGKTIPWKMLFKSVPVYALVIAHIGQNWGYYTLLTQMPNYLKNVLNFDLKSNGMISAMPYLLQAMVGWFSGYFGDRLNRSRKYKISSIRKLFNTIGFIGPAVCLFGITIARCDHIWNVVLLILAMGFNGFVYSGFSVTHVDMSPNYAGTLMGITNCIANFAGFLAPYFVGIVLQNNDLSLIDLWSFIFYTSSCVYIFTSIIFVIFGSAEQQLWDNTDYQFIPQKENRSPIDSDNHNNRDIDSHAFDTDSTKLK